jgi:hypothetical protein
MEGRGKKVNKELWYVCAGLLMSLLPVGSLVIYFPGPQRAGAVTNLEKSCGFSPLLDERDCSPIPLCFIFRAFCGILRLVSFFSPPHRHTIAHKKFQVARGLHIVIGPKAKEELARSS